MTGLDFFLSFLDGATVPSGDPGCVVFSSLELYKHGRHGLRSPNEGINQRNLIFWADLWDLIPYLLDQVYF